MHNIRDYTLTCIISNNTQPMLMYVAVKLNVIVNYKSNMQGLHCCDYCQFLKRENPQYTFIGG